MKLRWATKDDVPEMIRVIHDIWLKKEHYSCEDAEIVSHGFSYYYRNFDAYTDKRIVVATEDDRIIGIAGILPFPMPNMPYVVGAMLNPVGVVAEYRGKGVAKACMDYLFEHLDEEGYHLITVIGIPGYYPKRGFHPVFHQFIATLSAHNAIILEGGDDVEQATKETVHSVVEIFNKATDGNLFKIRRDEEWVERKFLHHEILDAVEARRKLPLGTLNLRDTYLSFRDGNPTAYMVIKEYSTALVIEEILGLDDHAIRSVLKEAGLIAQDRGIEKIIVNHAVPDGLTGTVLTDTGAAITMSTPWHFMLRVLSPAGLLQSMESVMEDRLEASQFANADLDGRLEIDGLQIAVSARGGKLNFQIVDSVGDAKLRRIKLYPKGLAKLIAGQFSAKELVNLGYIKVEEESDIEILSVLFPKHFPYIFETDGN